MAYQHLSRFQVIEDGALQLPGHCAVCKSTSGDMVDFGLSMDMYGVVYLCRNNCFNEAMNQLGYVSGEQYEGLKGRLEDEQSFTDTVLKENEELRNALGIVNRLRPRNDDSDRVELPVFEEPGTDSTDSTEDESGSDESDDESRFDHLFNDDGGEPELSDAI